jgi:hypothetical protein
VELKKYYVAPKKRRGDRKLENTIKYSEEQKKGAPYIDKLLLLFLQKTRK